MYFFVSKALRNELTYRIKCDDYYWDNVDQLPYFLIKLPLPFRIFFLIPIHLCCLRYLTI